MNAMRDTLGGAVTFEEYEQMRIEEMQMQDELADLKREFAAKPKHKTTDEYEDNEEEE